MWNTLCNFFWQEPVGAGITAGLIVAGVIAAGVFIRKKVVKKDNSKSDDTKKVHYEDVNAVPRNRPSFPGTPRIRFPGSLPLNNLPFVRNNYFTGREHFLEEIHTAFESGNTISLTQIIAGQGGWGKTQTALEYAYRYASNYDWIWWVPAETETTIFNAYQEFAIKMGLIEKEQQDRDLIIETVLNWMDTHERWLFIYDNMNEVSESTVWWPKNNRESILITTRNQHIRIGKKINIPIFEKEEAATFLEKRTNIDNDKQNALKLSKRLGYFPLALEQAAAYIRNNDLSFVDYLKLLDEYGLEVLEETEGIINYEKSVSVTLKISIKKLGEEAKQLLNLCAYLAPENIDATSFSDHTELLPKPLQTALSQALPRNKVWVELTKYSLLEKQDNKLGYSMHRLLQEVVRDSLNDEPQWAECCLSLLETVYDFEYGDIDSHNQFLALTPHVESCLRVAQTILVDDEKQLNIGSLYATAGSGNLQLGYYSKALEWYEKDLAIREKVRGKKHQETATTYNNIALVYSRQGDYARALEWYEKDSTSHEKVLGKEHPSTNTICNNITLVYSRQVNYTKALEWYEKALAISVKVLGKEHSETATTYNNIALVYSRQGEYAKALEWYKKALKIREKVRGKEHQETATTYNNIAGVYSRQGDYGKALEWYVKALTIREKVLGKDHPSIATTYNNIAGVYSRQGYYPTALEWYKKALVIREGVLGKEHQETAITYNNIAGVYDSQGDYDKALEWYEKDLAISEKVLGKEHQDTATIYNNMAGVYSRQGEFVKALDFYEKALVVHEKVLGKEHLNTQLVRRNIEELKSRV